MKYSSDDYRSKMLFFFHNRKNVLEFFILKNKHVEILEKLRLCRSVILFIESKVRFCRFIVNIFIVIICLRIMSFEDEFHSTGKLPRIFNQGVIIDKNKFKILHINESASCLENTNF
jgi:hypothetical protein